jgi:hypothetical protein
MSQPHILIFSNPLDSHIPYVTHHLDAHDVLIINPLAEVIDGNGIDYDFSNGTLKIMYHGHDLSSVKSIWYRKTSIIDRKRLPLPASKKGYAESALTTHIGSLAYLFPDAFWMSNRPAVWRANSKPLQLAYAQSLGMNVPETLFASTPAAAEAFVKKHRICIAKTQATEFPPHTIAFTKIIRDEDKLDFRGVQFDPYIFQQYIEPAYELRVTVVGTHIFPAKVFGNETDGISSSYRDWRYAHVNDTFGAEAATLPTAVARQCIALTQKFGLPYGAIDLIVDKRGTYWFLEINPNGQWAFVEEITGQPIGKAIAQKLQAAE